MLVRRRWLLNGFIGLSMELKHFGIRVGGEWKSNLRRHWNLHFATERRKLLFKMTTSRWTLVQHCRLHNVRWCKSVLRINIEHPACDDKHLHDKRLSNGEKKASSASHPVKIAIFRQPSLHLFHVDEAELFDVRNPFCLMENYSLLIKDFPCNRSVYEALKWRGRRWSEGSSLQLLQRENFAKFPSFEHFDFMQKSFQRKFPRHEKESTTFTLLSSSSYCRLSHDEGFDFNSNCSRSRFLLH